MNELSAKNIRFRYVCVCAFKIIAAELKTKKTRYRANKESEINGTNFEPK
jgi:hypothetical protein